MSPFHGNIEEFLTAARTSLENAQNIPEVAAAVAVLGFDDTRMAAGLAYLVAAEDLQAAQVREYGQQYEATAAFKEAFKQADAHYTIHRQLASLAIRESPEQGKQLLLHQPKKRSRSGWLQQARDFYTNLLADEDLVAALTRYNLARPDLEAGQALVAQVADLHEAQQTEKSQAQQATRDRDAALDALSDWLSEFRAVAQIALAATPQYLEALAFGPV